MKKAILFSFLGCLLFNDSAFLYSLERSFQYDASDNLSQVINADHTYIQYDYDSRNRLVKISDSNSKIIQYEYDTNDVRIKDEHGVTEYHYDHLGQLIKVGYPQSGTVHYSYDLKKRLQQITYPTGMIVAYSYDALGRLTSVKTPHGEIQYIYDNATNTLSKTILPNGMSTEYGYDNAKRMTSISHYSGEKTLIMGVRYVLDGNRNRISKEEINKDGSRFTYYTYDKLDRLICVKTPDWWEKYSYDELGNRLTKETPKELIQYNYDLSNRLTLAGDIQFFYDARDNLIKKTSPSKTANYVYDVHDNLIEYRDEEHVVLYGYDGKGERISKTVNGKKTFFFNNISSFIPQVLGESSEDNEVKTTYIYGLSRISQNTSEESLFYLYDSPNRNVLALVDQNDLIGNHYSYEPFGRLKDVDLPFSNHFTFEGESYEKETGLIFLRNRYYDPEIGRFISADPILGSLINPQSFNPYSYAQNNPINFIDPLGLRSARACAYLSGTNTAEGKSFIGHGFWVLTKDNGDVIIIGRHPGSPSLRFDLDKEYPGTVSFEWPATDHQINDIISSAEKGRYWGVAGNCIDSIERGLKVLDVKHPNFNLLGISSPIKAVLWLESLNGKDDIKRALEQDLKFVADPDLFLPYTNPEPVINPLSPNSFNFCDDSEETVEYIYDLKTRIVKVLSPISCVSYRYDKVGNLNWIKDANGNETQLEYDENSYLIAVIDPLGGLTQYEYNDCNCLTRIILPNGSTRKIYYDSLNRPIKESISN